MKEKRKYFLIIESIFWIIFITLPFFFFFLAYHWLPNESPEEGIHEILSSHEECDVYEQCGEVADAWRNIETGEIYSSSDFKKHSNIETIKMFAKFACYGLMGYLLYTVFEYFKKQKSNEERKGYIKIIYKNCPNCGNSKSPFWVKKYKCSECGADKFKWHTTAWCGNMLNPDKD